MSKRTGRLGDPQMSLATDPRTHRELLKGLKAHGMDKEAFLSADITPDAPLADIIAFARENEQSLEAMIKDMDFDVNHPWSYRQTTRTETFINGRDGNQVKLIVYRPAEKKASLLSAVVYFHGGGMVMLQTENPLHTTYAEAIAKSNLIAILVDFRNVLPSTTNLKGSQEVPLNPFPAGLNDCISAVKWIQEHKSPLQINKLILHGDSGGANLALATALELNQDSHTNSIIDGVFVLDPYISGAYSQPMTWKLLHLPSLVECDGYDISCSASAIYARLYYDVDQEHNPLAWPYWTTEENMVGLPPHMIMTAELDPLRDEGNEYCRKLVRAGVKAVGRVRLGMTHTGELLLRTYVPGEFGEVLGMLKGFVERLLLEDVGKERYA